MTKDRNSYSSIIKATSLFGGVKVFQILISIIRSKFIAVLLGPSGMGIAGLILSTISMIESLTGVGLSTSGVRDVARAFSSGDENRKNTTITVLRKLVLLTGILGALITFIFSAYLSEWSFGNQEYSIAFKIVSIVVFFNQITIGQQVLLQGTFHYKEIAKSSLYGSLLGLIFTIPLYYFFGVDGIVPAIVIASLIQLLLSWFYSRKLQFKKITLSLRQSFTESKLMIKLGIVIALTGFMSQGITYLIRVYISNYGSLSEVGLYTAGMAIATSYVGMVFSAMSTDYTPRLAAVADNNYKLMEVINKQAIFLITIIAPLVILFIVLIKQLVVILYSAEFIQIIEMLVWIMLGMFFRAISWTIAFSFVARGDTKIFFWNELLTKIYSFSFSIIGFHYLGLTGLGVAFLLTYLIYTIHMYILAKYKFNFFFSPEFFKAIIPQLLLTIVSFIIIKIIGYNIYRYIVGFSFFVFIAWLSYSNLNKMIDIKASIVNLKNKIK